MSILEIIEMIMFIPLIIFGIALSILGTIYIIQAIKEELDAARRRRKLDKEFKEMEKREKSRQ